MLLILLRTGGLLGVAMEPVLTQARLREAAKVLYSLDHAVYSEMGISVTWRM